MRRRYVIGGLAISAMIGLAGWYWFRPELLVISSAVHETFPETPGANAALLASGEFHGVAHETKGKAAIHQLSDGRRILRLTDFETSNGPALYVFLLAADDAVDSASVNRAEVVDLGKLKANAGEQNYELPPEYDSKTHRAVTIWCRRFSVNFATAPLQQQ